MGDDLTYKIIPHEPQYKAVSLTEEERKNIGGLEAGCFLWGVMVIAILIVTGVLSNWLGISFADIYVYMIVTAITVASVAIAWMAKHEKKKNISQLEKRKIEEAKNKHQYEVRRITTEAASLTSSLLATYKSSTQIMDVLPEHLNQASLLLEDAENEYHANAFAPFWDAVESAAHQLAAFNDKTNSLSRNAGEYYNKLKGKNHTFPPFPIRTEAIPDATPVVKEFRRIVRMGQTNFQFANIWEHRRTREVLIAGFQTLGEAVNNLGMALESSIYNLQQSVSSDLAKIVEEEIKTRETLDIRLIEQTRQLNNLPRRRRPKRKDVP